MGALPGHAVALSLGCVKEGIQVHMSNPESNTMLFQMSS